MSKILSVAARHPQTWKRVCWSIIVLLLPWLLANVVNGHAWVTYTIWGVGLLLVWTHSFERKT